MNPFENNHTYDFQRLIGAAFIGSIETSACLQAMHSQSPLRVLEAPGGFRSCAKLLLVCKLLPIRGSSLPSARISHCQKWLKFPDPTRVSGIGNGEDNVTARSSYCAEGVGADRELQWMPKLKNGFHF